MSSGTINLAHSYCHTFVIFIIVTVVGVVVVVIVFVRCCLSKCVNDKIKYLKWSHLSALYCSTAWYQSQWSINVYWLSTAVMESKRHMSRLRPKPWMSKPKPRPLLLMPRPRTCLSSTKPRTHSVSPKVCADVLQTSVDFSNKCNQLTQQLLMQFDEKWCCCISISIVCVIENFNDPWTQGQELVTRGQGRKHPRTYIPRPRPGQGL